MTSDTLPLFPLHTVAFPDGFLKLKVFETRYINMMYDCLRKKTPFGIVALFTESQVNLNLNPNFKAQFPFANIGTSFEIKEADVSHLGLINIACVGKQKFKILSAHQNKDGLWMADIEYIAKEVKVTIPEELESTKNHLQHIIESLDTQDIAELELSIAKPYQLQDCAWVSNRWCEILDLPLIQKQRLLELDSPVVRLELVSDMLDIEFLDEK